MSSKRVIKGDRRMPARPWVRLLAAPLRTRWYALLESVVAAHGGEDDRVSPETLQKRRSLLMPVSVEAREHQRCPASEPQRTGRVPARPVHTPTTRVCLERLARGDWSADVADQLRRSWPPLRMSFLSALIAASDGSPMGCVWIVDGRRSSAPSTSCAWARPRGALAPPPHPTAVRPHGYRRLPPTNRARVRNRRIAGRRSRLRHCELGISGLSIQPLPTSRPMSAGSIEPPRPLAGETLQ